MAGCFLTGAGAAAGMALAPGQRCHCPRCRESTTRSRDDHVMGRGRSPLGQTERMGTPPLQLRQEDGRHLQGPFTGWNGGLGGAGWGNFAFMRRHPEVRK